MSELTSAVRPVAIIEYLAGHPEGMTLRDLREEYGLARSSAWHLVKQLQEAGFIDRVDSNRFVAGARLLQVGLGLYQTATMGGVPHQALERLSRITGMDVYLAIRSGDDVVYADRVTGVRSVQLNRSLGIARPLHASAPGKLFLAYDTDGLWERKIEGRELRAYTNLTVTDPERLRAQVRQAREDGFIGTCGEVLSSIASLAGMVSNPDGSPWAAVTLSAHESDLQPVRDEALAHLLDTVVRMTETRAGAVSSA